MERPPAANGPLAADADDEDLGEGDGPGAVTRWMRGMDNTRVIGAQ